MKTFLLAKSDRGLTLTELVIAVGIASIGLSVILFPILETAKLDRGREASQFLSEYRERLMRAVRHQPSWNTSVASVDTNANMACLRERTDCSPLRNQANRLTLFELNPSDNSIVILNDSRVLTSGFTTQGQPCATFNNNAPSDQCPIRVTLAWRPQCGNLASGQTCTNPEIMVSANVIISSSNSSLKALNPLSFGFRIYRGSQTDSLSASCAAMGGLFSDNGTPETSDDTCTVNSLANCPAGQAVIGFFDDGSPRCSSLSMEITCPTPGPPNYEPTFLQGIDANGQAICTPCP
jgi:prepilin-type N-terminal cleavage/methylation domain-containing protein